MHRSKGGGTLVISKRQLRCDGPSARSIRRMKQKLARQEWKRATRTTGAKVTGKDGPST
jgi:hypothetical protein